MNQFRALNKPTILDRLWNLLCRLKFGSAVSNVFLEFNVVLYRFWEKIELSKDVYVKRNSILGCANERARLCIGARTTIGFNTTIMASDYIEIGSDCMIAPNVYIVDSNHATDSGCKFNTQSNIVKRVVIGNNVWIGTGVIVLPGVTISDGVVIGAGSLVTRSLLEPGIYIGSPARKK